MTIGNDEYASPLIVYVTHCGKMSGAEIALLRMAENARHVRVHVIVTEGGPFVDELQRRRVSATALTASRAMLESRHPRRYGRIALAVVGQILTLWALNRELRRHNGVRIVVSNSLRAHFYVRLAKTMGGGWRHVAYVRDRIAPDYLGAFRHRLTSCLFRYCEPDAIIANSSTTMGTVPKSRRSRPRVVIPSPIDVPAPLMTQGLDATLSQVHPKTKYGILGRIAPWKGQDLVLRAFVQAFHDDESVTLEIAGAPLFGEHEFMARLRDLSRELGVEDRVTFLGHVDDVYPKLLEWTAVIHASVVAEPLGQVVVQGMAIGRPVIASGEGGPTEIITDGVDGVLFEPRSVASLAKHWRVLHESPALRSTLSENALKAAVRYRTSAVVEEVESFLLNVS